jgi:hypothetical protein
LAVRDESVDALGLGYGGCDRVVKQGALRDEGRTSVLRDISDQGIEYCPEPPGDLIASAVGELTEQPALGGV